MSNATQGGGGQSAYNSNKVTLTGQNSADGIDPLVEVTYTSALEGQGQSEVTIDIEVSGATTPNLTLNAESITTATVKCKISQPNAVLNRADANGDTIFSNGTLDGGLVTKDALFESISENNKSISIVNTEIVDDKVKLSQSNTIKEELNNLQDKVNPLTKEEGKILKSNTVETSPQKKEEHANS